MSDPIPNDDPLVAPRDDDGVIVDLTDALPESHDVKDKHPIPTNDDGVIVNLTDALPESHDVKDKHPIPTNDDGVIVNLTDALPGALPESKDVKAGQEQQTSILYDEGQMADTLAAFCRGHLVRREAPPLPLATKRIIEFIPITEGAAIDWDEQKELVLQDLDSLEECIQQWRQAVRTMDPQLEQFKLKTKLRKKKQKKKKAAAAAAAS